MTETCPKCGSPRIEGDECLRCGVIVSKYRAYLDRLRERQMAAPRPPGPAAAGVPAPTRWFWNLILVTVLVVIGLWALSPAPGGARGVAGLWAGATGSRAKAAAEFTVETLGGDRVSLSQFQGRPVFLYFWATW